MLKELRTSSFQEIIYAVQDAPRTDGEVDGNRLLKHARLLARVSGDGYWVEATILHDDSTPLEWIPIQWHEDKANAINHAAELHEKSTSDTFHRVVGERRTVQIFNQYNRGDAT